MSACILFNVFSIEEIFPVIAARDGLIRVGDHSGERVTRVLSLFDVFCCVDRFHVTSLKGVLIVAVIVVLFSGYGRIKGPKNGRVRQINLTFRRSHTKLISQVRAFSHVTPMTNGQ